MSIGMQQLGTGIQGQLPYGQQGMGQLRPQGWFGDLLGTVGVPAGQAIGSIFGSPQTGATIGGLAGQLGSWLPFGVAAPGAYGQQGMGQLRPQGWFGGGLLGGWGGGALGNAIGGLFGGADVGSTIGGGIGSILGGLLPFQSPVPLGYWPQGQGQLAPQGLVGDILGAVGAPLGQVLGGHWGYPELGSQLGTWAGQLGQQYIPFTSTAHPFAPGSIC